MGSQLDFPHNMWLLHKSESSWTNRKIYKLWWNTQISTFLNAYRNNEVALNLTILDQSPFVIQIQDYSQI